MRLKIDEFEPKRLRDINLELKKMEYRLKKRSFQTQKRESWFSRVTRFLRKRVI